jgi:predicted metalloprotease with PDZ domain
VGGAVRLVDADGHDAAWFAEGFTVHFARRALLDADLARPGELLPDLRRTLGEVAPGEEPLPPDYRRGAQWAALLDASVRKHSNGARGLEHVIHDLVARARVEGKLRLPLAALRDALGPKAGADLDRLAAHPYAAFDLPDTAFDPCFRRVSRETSGFDLGFAGLHAGAGVVHEVVRGSAAFRAGVREGMVVISSRVPEERDALQGAEVELRVEAKRKPRTLRYRPLGKKTVTAWEVAPCGK